MKKIWLILMLALSVVGVRAATVTYNPTNGQLLYPTGFFRQHVIPGQGMVTQYGTGSNTLTLYVLTNSPSSPGMLPPWQTNALWSNGTWEQWSNLFRGNSNVVITQTPTGMVFSLTNVAASSSGMTIESTPATNLFSFGIIDLDDFGGGNWGIDINNGTIGTNKWTDSAYNWVLSIGGSGGGTTNGFGVNGVYRTDWNFLNSAVIVSTTSGGTNFYLSIVDGSVGTNKFDATAYNLLITDAVGLGTNALVNGIKRQPFALTNNPGTGGVIWITNANGEVLAYATNIPSGGGGGLGTNFVLNGTLMQPAIITNSLSVVWTTNANGHVKAVVSLVDSNIPSTIARLESPTFTGTVTFSNLFVSNLQIPFASRYVWANGSSNLAATSDGQSWTNLNGSSIVTGTVADARLDPAVARLASPTFTGDPKVPTASAGDNDTSAASTAFLAQRIPNIAYDATTWNNNTNAPTMDAVRDKIESMGGGGGGGLGTNVFVNGILSQPARFTNGPTLIWTTNADGGIVGTVTNVAGSTTSNVLQRTGIAVFDIYDAGVNYDIRNVYTYGCITNVNIQNGNEATQGRLNISLTDRGTTNYFVSSEIESSYGDGNGGPVGFVEQSTRTTSYFDYIIFGTAGSATPTARVSIIIMEPVTVGGSGGVGDALTTNPLSQFAATTSSQLAGVISDETGTGALVYAGSPALTGNPTVPTQSLSASNTTVASTAFAQQLAELRQLTSAILTQLAALTNGSAGQVPTWTGSNTLALSNIVSGGSAADVQVFSAGSNTWTKPSGKAATYVIAFGGGGGGGAGRRGAAGTIRSGGGGGGSGAFSDAWFLTSALGSTEPVIVGGGGAGAVAQTANDSNGGGGASGTNSTFGTWISAGGAGGGVGGDADGSSGGTQGFGKTWGSLGGASSATGAAGAIGGTGINFNTGAGGGAGGGITSGDSVSSGGAGGEGPRMWRGASQLPGGTAGSAGGAGGNGNAAGSDVWIGGSGGGGGASSISAAAGAGGNGGNFGAGGGGGGASLNGNNSGAGGRGASGIVVVISN